MRRVLYLLLAICWPTTAFAHSSLPGMQGIYWGMLHPFTSGPQLLALFALSLLIQQRLSDSEDVFHSFWVGCLVGAGTAALGLTGFDPDILLTALAILAGVLAASAVRLPLPVLLSVGTCCGLVTGYLSWPDPGAKGDMMFTAIGSVVGSVLILIVLAGVIEMVWQARKWLWLPIAVRVAASWVTAISVLLGALLVRNML